MTKPRKQLNDVSASRVHTYTRAHTCTHACASHTLLTTLVVSVCDAGTQCVNAGLGVRAGVRGGASARSLVNGLTSNKINQGANSMNIQTMSLVELKKQLDALALVYQERQKPGSQDRDVGLFSDAVHQKLDELLAGNITGNVGPLAIRELFRVPGTWGPILAFLERTGYVALPPAEKAVIYGFLADLVVRHAYSVSRRSRAPMSPKLVANCSGNLGSLFDREFPGYLRAGLAKLVAKRLCMPSTV